MEDKTYYMVDYGIGDEDDTTYIQGIDKVKEFIEKPEIEEYTVWKDVSNEIKKTEVSKWQNM